MRKKRRINNNHSLLMLDNPKSPLAEAFRNLRTSIQFVNVDAPLKSILVTSAGPSEGKSTIVANLAVTLAHSGNKVLIMDCDLRKPVQQRIFSLRNSNGLTSLLLDKFSLDEAVQATATENLFAVTSGPIPPNPSELLGSKKFNILLDEFTSLFDYVLIDSPPVGVVTDGIVLSSQVNGVILTVLAEKSKVDQVKYAQEQLLKAKANILGIVLNQVPRKGRSYYYYNHYSETNQ